MPRAALRVLALGLLLGLGGCVVVDPYGGYAGPGYGPPPHAGPPPGHMPPPGECRTWIPGVPPGQQPPPYRCR